MALGNIAKRAEAYKPKERVTYKMIKEYIEAKYGFKVHTAYIAEVKRSLGLPMYDGPNAVEELKQPRKHPTAEKVEAIKDALKYYKEIQKMIEEKDYRYVLPGENNNPVEYQVKCHSMIIIGANGSGKSQLGAWIEKNNPNDTHRIGAQRSLMFGNYIQQKSYEQATNLIIYGQENPTREHNLRWGWDGEKYNYTSSLLNDYENVLSALVALQINQQEQFIKDCKQREKNGEIHNLVPEMVIDKLQRIWKSVFPHRDIIIQDGKVLAGFEKDGQYYEYKGRDMSDGERVGLYLIAQSLCVPSDKTIIIDEPEIHLHRSIMNKLWEAIEAEREDCFFIYITHDTQFASNHKNSKKLWIKGFDGITWEWEEVQNSELPEQLLLDILGNRKPVLFVEGTHDSYDTKLYSEIYKDYYVVPCGSCSSVISQTKAMNSNAQLHNFKCFGIIDRDYRTDYEIEAYKEDNIFTLEVAEVENLFLTEELLQVVNRIMEFPDNSRIENVKKYIIEERFKKEINKQICEAVVSELKYRLSVANISKRNEEQAKETLNKLFEEIDYDTIKMEQMAKFERVLKTQTYKDVLRVFNCKSLSTSIGHFFKLDNKDYRDFIVRQIKGKRVSDIIDAIVPYLPNEIPIECT